MKGPRKRLRDLNAHYGEQEAGGNRQDQRVLQEIRYYLPRAFFECCRVKPIQLESGNSHAYADSRGCCSGQRRDILSFLRGKGKNNEGDAEIIEISIHGAYDEQNKGRFGKSEQEVQDAEHSKRKQCGKEVGKNKFKVMAIEGRFRKIGDKQRRQAK